MLTYSLLNNCGFFLCLLHANTQEPRKVRPATYTPNIRSLVFKIKQIVVSTFEFQLNASQRVLFFSYIQ